MKTKSLWLFLAMLFFAQVVVAQNTNSSTVTTSASLPPSVDTNINFYLFAQRHWNKYVAPFPNDNERREQYDAWYRFWEPRVNLNPTSNGSMFGTINQLYDVQITNRWDCLGTGGNWRSLGPDRSFFGQVTTDMQGRMHAMWISPTDQNYILAASAMGGLWKTTDGGQNWKNITDGSNLDQFPGTLGIDLLAVNPINNNYIYLSTSSYGSTDDWNGRYGLGLMYSNDGGQNWQVDQSYRTLMNTTSSSGWSRGEVWKMAYEPGTQILYAISSEYNPNGSGSLINRRVLVKPSPTSNWQDITPAMITNSNPYYNITDFQFVHNVNGGIIVATTGFFSWPIQHLFRYDESINSWTDQQLQFIDTVSVTAIGLASNDQVYLVANQKIYSCGSTGSTTTFRKNLSFGSTHRLIVSPTNSNLMYVTNAMGLTPNVERVDLTSSNTTGIGETHADCRDFQIYSSGSNPNGIDDIIFSCTDGGVAKKDAGTNTFHSITGNGLVVTEFNSVRSMPEDDDIMVGGATDNGIQAYSGKNSQPWTSPQWADGLMVAFSRNNTGVAYTQYQGGLNTTRLKLNGTSNNLQTNINIGQPTQGSDEDYKLIHSARRPMNFDINNTASVGFHWLWSEQLNSSNWTATFGDINKQPKPGFTIVDTDML